ncbi:MAG: TRAP transporter permease [Lawsonibacter sp.]
MARKKEVKEIDVTSLDSELAAAKTLEEGKGSPFIKAASVVALLMGIFHIFTGYHGLLPYISQRGIHLAFGVTIVLLANPLHEHFFKKKFANIKAFEVIARIIDLILIVAIWAAVFMARDEVSKISDRLGVVTFIATIAGALLLFIVLEATRRCLGWIMPILALIFIAYALAGPYLPLSIAHRGYSMIRIFQFLATDLDGIFGTTMSVSATVIFMFVMFGSFLEQSGCSSFINNIAFALTGKIRAGAALSAVVASALMGTINGSAVANVVGTGTFTIPLMKSRGYRAPFAAGVESVASTGGQILPPVMGSGAFLMVAFTNEPYISIVICAVVPALLYFIGAATAVISQSEIAEIEVVDPKDIPRARDVLKDGWIYLVIIAVLIYCLLVAQLSPLRSALYASTSVPIIMLFDKKKRFRPKHIVTSLIKSGFGAMSIVMGCACAGIVVAMTSLTGIGVVFGDMMIKAAGGNLFLSLLFTAMACIILGMGLPTTSAYVIAASILAPSLITLGLPILTAHLFVFYFACLSAITPPVALAAYAGAGLAKCSPMSTAVEACKLGFAGFIAPFAFCYSDGLLLRGDLWNIIPDCVTALLGTLLISVGFQGWLLWKLNPIERLLLVGAGTMMFTPGSITDIAGLAIAVLLILINMKKWKKPAKAAS